jgi:hypothetical protein
MWCGSHNDVGNLHLSTTTLSILAAFPAVDTSQASCSLLTTIIIVVNSFCAYRNSNAGLASPAREMCRVLAASTGIQPNTWDELHQNLIDATQYAFQELQHETLTRPLLNSKEDHGQKTQGAPSLILSTKQTLWLLYPRWNPLRKLHERDRNLGSKVLTISQKRSCRRLEWRLLLYEARKSRIYRLYLTGGES